MKRSNDTCCYTTIAILTKKNRDRLIAIKFKLNQAFSAE